MESNVSTSSSGPRSTKGLVISFISLILFVAIIAFAVHESSKATVTVQVDGEEYVVKTHASTVADLMAEQGWDYQEHDLIEPALDAEISGNMTVSWKKAVQVFATLDGEEKTIWTTADTVEQLIDEIDLQVKKQDKLKPSLETAITEGLELNYESAFQVELISDGEERKVWTTSTTVADFLEKEEIELGELDRVEPELSDEIDQETDIRVIRVEKVTDVVEESVAFATVTRKDEKLDSGKEKVVEEGQEGKVAHHYEVILEDGEEISRELVKTETVEESKDRVVAVGTRKVQENVSRSSGSSSSSSSSTSSSSSKSDQSSKSESSSSSSSGGGKTFTVTATAYTANCSGCSGVTATGINLNNNRNMKVIAVDPNVIPLGSRVHVEGYGTAIAGDTGGAIVGNKIDVHMPSTAEAQRWGRKTVKVTILD